MPLIVIEVKIPPVVSPDRISEILGNIKLRYRLKNRLLLDARRVKEYDISANRILIRWIEANNQRIDRVAVISDHPIWDVLVSKISLKSGVLTRMFSNKSEALSWLGQADT